MKLTSVYLLLSVSLCIGFFSPPSLAVTTIMDVLSHQNIGEAKEYILTLDIEQIRDALNQLDVEGNKSGFIVLFRKLLLERLRELKEKDGESDLPDLLIEEDEEQDPHTNSGGGGGGGSDGDDFPSFSVGGSSGASIFGRRPSPWNNPEAFLAEALSEMLSPVRLDIPLPQPARPSEEVGSQHQSMPSIGGMISFSPLHFLHEAKEKLQNSDLKAKIGSFLSDPKRDHSQTIALCWQAISKLKAQIINSGNLEDLPFTYMTMAKLVLATQMPPSFEMSAGSRTLGATPEETRNRFNSYLRDRLKTFNLDKHQEKPNKIYKWSLIYHALLNMDYVKRNPGQANNLNLIVDAHNFLHKAGKLKTTKSTHAFLAHLYLEHGHLLHYDKEEIDVLVDTELGQFHKSEEPEIKKSSRAKAAREVPSFWSVAAQPPYYRDRVVQEDVKSLFEQLRLQEQGHEQEGGEIPGVLTQMSSEAAASLPARAIDGQYLLERRTNYVIQGRVFTNYNVSGRDFRCFFNSLGVDAEAQIRFLLRHQDDPRIRAIIANEIVSAWRTYYQLPQAVRAELNARDLVERQARVDRLAGGDSQIDLRVELRTEQEAIMTELRKRASTVGVFISFVTNQIGTRIDGSEEAPYPMMVMQQDVRAGDENDLPNLSAIDAIALVNSIGIRVFRIEGAELYPIHTFIPHEAESVAHLVYSAEAQHFTALVPADEAVPVGEEVNFDASDAQIQAAYEDAIQQDTITENLASLLQERFPLIENTSSETDEHTRLILFLNSQGLGHAEIALRPLINLSKSRIGAILQENGIHRKLAFDEETIDLIYNAYLSSRYGLKGRGYGFSEIAGPIAQHLGLDQNAVRRFLESQATNGKPFVSRRGGIDADERSLIVNLYKENPKFSSIHAETGFPNICILEILEEDLPDDLRPKMIDPSKVIRSESPEERNKKIVDAFHYLTRPDGGTPSASDVSRHCGYTLKVTLKALKDAGLIAHTNKSKHLSIELVNRIKAEWIARGWDLAPDKLKHYRDIAEQFGISANRVRELLRGRAYTETSGIKRKQQASASDIQAAYEDLNPTEKPNALAILSPLFNCSERQIAEALNAIGVYLSPGNGSKKTRRE